jgi:hypothetical protein
MCNTDLLLKHPDATLATYVRRQIKHLNHASKTLAKMHEKYLKTITNIHNIQIKCHICEKCMQHPDKHTCNNTSKNTDETLETDLCNMHIQPLQHVQHSDILLQHSFETIATYL